MNTLEEFDHLLRKGYNINDLYDIKPKLDNYLLSCPEDEKNKCQMYIELANKFIDELKEREQLRDQYNLLHDYVTNHRDSEFVGLEFIEPYGNSYGVYIKVDKYIMELVFKPMNEPEKNEVRTKFYLDVDGLYKQFMIKKELIPSNYENLQQKRRDYYPTNTNWGNWGNLIIKTIKAVENKPQGFLQICESSCPFNNNGTHKYKSWRTKAKVEVTYEANTGIIQGIKNGGTPPGAHIAGGNGSFRFNEKGDYVLKVTVDCLAVEKPIRHDCYFNIDTIIRQLKEAKKWGRNLPYQKVNEPLNEKVEVITYDMDKEPFERSFYPIEYGGNWITFLEEKFKEI